MSPLPPAIQARGKIFLTPLTVAFGGRTQMTTDPDSISEDWQERKYTTMALEGARTTEDQGFFAIDYFRTLVWSGGGRAQWLDVDVVNQLEQWRAALGATFRYEDGEGNDFTVEILPPFKADREFGQPRNYRVTLNIHALAMTIRRGVLYTGQ